MSRLSQATSGIEVRPRRTLTYGVHGIGKSSFAAGAPGVAIIPTEEGLDDIAIPNGAKLPMCHSLSDVMDTLAELYTVDHSFTYVAIDTLDSLERMIWAKVCEEKKVDNIEDIGYAKGYTFALTYWKEVLDGLSALRNQKNMGVVLVAHAEIRSFNNPETDAYDRYMPRLHRHASALICEWCDEVLFATFKVLTKTQEKFGQTRAKAIPEAERILRTTERATHVGKNRLGLPEELPFPKENPWKIYQDFFPTKETN